MSSATQLRSLGLIEERFLIHNVADERDLLAGHPEIADLLREAKTMIPGYFGRGTEVTLRVHDYPDEERRCIAAYIRAALEPAEAIGTTASNEREVVV